MAVRVTFKSRHDAYLLTQALLEAAAVAYQRGERYTGRAYERVAEELADSFDECEWIPPCNATPAQVARLAAV